MASVKLIVLILALNSNSILSLRHNSKGTNRMRQQHETVWCPAECDQPIASPCQPNPCLYGGSCITTDDQQDYRCVNCPYPMGGKMCSELTCHPNCLRVDDKIYFIFPNKDNSQHASHLKCKEHNMTLAMIKDNIVHHQIRKQITVMNIDNLDPELCYWIGLRQANGASPWKWFDGTELGAYDDWGNRPYSDYYCGQICRYKVYKFTRDSCSGTDGWTYFSFCEKSYPFLKG